MLTNCYLDRSFLKVIRRHSHVVDFQGTQKYNYSLDRFEVHRHHSRQQTLLHLHVKPQESQRHKSQPLAVPYSESQTKATQKLRESHDDVIPTIEAATRIRHNVPPALIAEGGVAQKPGKLAALGRHPHKPHHSYTGMTLISLM